jgi:hypothetical protein
MEENLNEGRTQIKRQYGQYSKIKVNEKAPIRNKVIGFVGKRFVTEEEMKNFLSKMNEESGKTFDDRKWFGRNQRYFESFENRGQKVITLSKYGKRVMEMITKVTQRQSVNESIGLFKSQIFEKLKGEETFGFEFSDEDLAYMEITEGTLAVKADRDLGVYLSEIEPESKEWSELYDAIASKLGEDLDSVLMVDSETNEEDPLSSKIYNYLSTHFNSVEPVETPSFKNSKMGSFQMYDPKLNVVRLDDYGFVAFYFTAKSKF